MGGIILYVYFLLVGFLYADMLFKEKDIYFRIWMGGVFGSVILMAGIVLPALMFGFTAAAHIVLAVLAAAPYVIIKLRRRDEPFISIALSGEKFVDKSAFFALILPVSAVIWILMINHILAPASGGGYAAGQCTYGDLQMHLGFITSIAEQKEFPPEYNLLSGETLSYPFFADMLSSSLYLFKTPLRWAVIVPSCVISFLLVEGFYILAYSLTKRKAAAVIATLFLFFNGGFGLAYFLEGAKSNPTVFTEMFTKYYQTPTNYSGENIRWSNTICDMIIPQRTTMAGWCVILPAIWLLTDALKTKSRREFIILGILSGCMPMIHTHSLLALGLISAVMFFAYLAGEENKKDYVINWVIFGAIAIGMALPQLCFWTFRQTSGNSSFLRLHFNWVNKDDPYFWFYLKNWGIAALFAVPAILGASKDNKKLLAGCALVFIAAEFILFQPNEYDNNKLIYIPYMMLLIIISGWLLTMWDAMKNIRGRGYFAALTIAAGTLSGALTVGREYRSAGEYRTFTADDIAMADYIRENTPPDAVFLTGTDHVNPVCALAGRTIYLGSSIYVYFHGYGTEFYDREKKLKKAYSGTYEELTDFCRENGVDYVYVGARERSDLDVNNETLSRLERVYSSGSGTLFKVNQ